MWVAAAVRGRRGRSVKDLFTLLSKHEVNMCSKDCQQWSSYRIKNTDWGTGDDLGRQLICEANKTAAVVVLLCAIIVFTAVEWGGCCYVACAACTAME